MAAGNDQVGRALLASAVALREVADAAYDAVTRIDADADPVDELRRLRRDVRNAVNRAIQMRAVAFLLDGATWRDVADGLGLNVTTAHADLADTVEVWRVPVTPGEEVGDLFGDSTLGTRHDPDPAGTATCLDAWLARHRDIQFGAAGGGPVAQALG